MNRIITIVMAVFIALSLAACSGSKDDKGDTTHESAKETAASTAEEIANGVSLKNADSALIGKWESNAAPGTFYIFNADGTGSLEGEGYSMQLTYIDKGTSVVILYADAEKGDEQEYTVEGDKLTLAGIPYTAVEAFDDTAADSEAQRGSEKATEGTKHTTDFPAQDTANRDTEEDFSAIGGYSEKYENTEETSQTDDTTVASDADTLPDLDLDDYELPFVGD